MSADTLVGGDDEQRRAVEFACGAGALGEGEHLQGLAQAHVVGEHTAEPGVPQQRRPAAST